MSRLSQLSGRALDAIGVRSPFWRKAIPPVVVAAVVVRVSLALGATLSLTLVVLLAITYALYLMPRRWRRTALPVTALVIAVIYPFLVAEDWLFDIPIFSTLPSMDTMVIMAIFTMMALGLNMVVGYAGLLDLGYVAFYAIGAYTAAWFASPHFAGPDVVHRQAEPRLLVRRGRRVPGCRRHPYLHLARPADRRHHHGLRRRSSSGCRRCVYAVTTSPSSRWASERWSRRSPATATKVASASTSRTARRGSTRSTRRDSARGCTTRSFYRRTSSTSIGWFEGKNGDFVGDFVDLVYWGALALVLITLFCSIRLRDSRLGRAWIAIREDETAAAAMGIPLMRTKTWSYASGAFFGGVAGAWFATYQQGVFPDSFNFNVSIFILCMVILGGMGNVWGVIAGAAFLSYLNTEGLANLGGWLNEHVLPCGSSPEAGQVISNGCVDVPAVQFGIYGVILVVVMLFRPVRALPRGEAQAGVRGRRPRSAADGRARRAGGVAWPRTCSRRPRCARSSAGSRP